MRKQALHPSTAIINKEQKNKSKKARADALMWLMTNFPDAFDNSLRVRPLKKKIMEDILLHADEAATSGISRSKLRQALVVFTRRIDYLACLKLRGMRIDLQGNEAGEVTEKEAEYAANKIKKCVEKSIKNSGKITVEKSIRSLGNQYVNPSKISTGSSAPCYQPNNGQIPSGKSSTVLVTHKTTRQYDPYAVARLKEKLGLSRDYDEENKGK